MNKIPFFLDQWVVPDHQPINCQLYMYSDTVHILAQDNVSTFVCGDRGRATDLVFCLPHIVNVQFDSNVDPVDCLWNKTNMHNKIFKIYNLIFKTSSLPIVF